MKRVLLAGAALALGILPALAADLPSRRAPPVFAPPPPIPVFSWTGFYVGAQAGYAFGKEDTIYAITGNGANLFGTSSSPNGFIGGGHVGYNFSTQSIPVLGGLGFGAGGLVLGIEGDVDGADYHRTLTTALFGGASASVRSDIQGSVRGRVGFAVDRALFYATGGAAFADFRNTTTVNLFGTDVYRHSVVGYTVGGGIEYAFTNQLSVRVEYRYSDFDRYSENLANSTLTAADAKHHETMNRVQAGLSYKFETFAPAPVVARY